MDENESIDDMIIKFTKITNDLSSLANNIDNDPKLERSFELFPFMGSQVNYLERTQ